MARLALPDVGEIAYAIRRGVEERLGRRRRLCAGEDLVDDVGLTPEQVGDLTADLESRFGVLLETEPTEPLTCVGSLLVRLVRRCCTELDAVEEEAA